jgi:hypothetical protein
VLSVLAVERDMPEQQLSDKVDIDQLRGLLAKLGVDPGELIGRLGAAAPAWAVC